MPERAYRQILREAPVARTDTAAGASVLRMALGMLCADARAPLSAAERQTLLDRLQVTGEPFSVEEKGELRAPLLGYIAQYHPRILAIVEAQFREDHLDGRNPHA